MHYVIGSGPAGIAAASALLDRGVHVTMLDVGVECEADRMAFVEGMSSREPEEWTRDEQRRHACHVPPEVRYHTRQEQCVEMLDQWRAHVPHSWVTGDDELGRHTQFRQDLR